MGKTVNKDTYYFTQETEDAIVQYNTSSDPIFRDRLFKDKIYYPLYKLAENIIHTFKFYYLDVDSIEDLKLDVVSMLVEEKLHKFDPTNGAKAFSYLQTIVKRWLIAYNYKNYRKLKQVESFESFEGSYDLSPLDIEEKTIPIQTVVDHYIEHIEEGIEEFFNKSQEQEVVEAVMTLFRTRNDLDIFKKKALYIYIREMTECETPVLTKVINKLKEEYINISNTYIESGYTIQY